MTTPTRSRAHRRAPGRRKGGTRGHYLVVAGQAVGQLSALAVMPVLTRAFDPSELGHYQVALATALVAQPLTTLRVEYVLPAIRAGSTARALVRRAGITLALIDGLAMVAAAITWAADYSTVAEVLFMTAMLNIVYAWIALDNALLVRRGETRRLAARNLLSGLLASGLQLAVALTLANALALAGGVFLGRLAAIAFTSSRRARYRDATGGAGAGADAPYTALRAVTTISSGVLSGLVTNGLTLTTAAALGNAPAAFVATAQRVSGVPASLVGNALGQIAQLAAARSLHGTDGGRLGQALRPLVIRLSTLGAMLLLAMVFLGPPLAEPVLGSQWSQVGALLPLLAPTVALQLVVSPLNPVLVMIGKERVILAQQAWRFVVSIGASAAAAAVTQDLVTTVAWFGATTTVAYLVNLVVIARHVRKFDATSTSSPPIATSLGS